MESPLQLVDDVELLQALALDEQERGDVTLAALEWSERLRRAGLEDLRRSPDPALWDPGIVELPPTVVPFRTLGRAGRRLRRRVVACLELLEDDPTLAVLPLGLSISDLHQTAYRLSELAGEASGARPLRELQASLAGDPASHFDVDGRSYTMSFLDAYWRYAFVCRSVDLDELERVCVVGPGVGVQAELLHRAHPRLELLLVGGAAELYLAERFLRATFPDDVDDYRETRKRAAWADPSPGRIRIPALHTPPRGRTTAPTLLWDVPSGLPGLGRDVHEELLSLADVVYACGPPKLLDKRPRGEFPCIARGPAFGPLRRRGVEEPEVELLRVRETSLEDDFLRLASEGDLAEALRDDAKLTG